ncbi:MAG TPA: methylmalonyl-CoA mutase family protein, partial [Beijerinckiaceae bacterium]|nr:methylmalonyl-CoA mutase family protein [Beijerinckiaceae bacterium]
GAGRHAAALLVALAERRGHPLAALSLDLALDPIGAMAATGRLSAPWEVVAARCAQTLTALAERGFADKAFLAEGRPWHEAGAGEAQELAAVLATGLAYLRALEAGGHALDAARDAVAFLLVADADEFLSLAKFRALRRLWARVEELCGLAPKPIRLHAETAWRMATRRDPWVNMLRATVATFAAGLGGADSVTVLPFTTALGLPDGFARRVARNTQHVLLEEANLWRVADPAAGAGAFEALTEGLCERAWALFREIEGEGGIVASLQAGAVQARIAAARAARERDVATRREPITGTSAFPDLREAPVAVLMQAAAVPESAPEPAQPPAGSFGDLVAVAHSRSLPAPAAGAAVAEPLPSLRAAEPFEHLRDASDAILARTGARPRVFLATLGPVAAFTARATFARALFEAGGIEAVGGEAYDSLEAMAVAFRASGTLRACLCSSDPLYAAQAPDAARRLKEAGCRTLFLAGRAAEAEAELRQAGVDAFVFTGADVLSLLHSAYAEEEGGPSPVSP